LRDFRARLRNARAESGSNPELRAAAARALEEFETGMDDDLNTSVALAAIHDLKREVNTALDSCAIREDDRHEILALVERFNSVLNVFPDEEPSMLDEDIQRLIDERQEARHRRDFARADEIRDRLAARGIVLEDTRDGVRWKRR
jgi:cysteinyl-tRNA synthetase